MKEFITVNDEAFFGKNDSETIQNAIFAAEKDGCRKIVIPRYNLRTDSAEWRIPVCIMIPSDFTVILDNCYMVQETGVFDNMFANSYAHDSTKYDIKFEQHDISIIGEGNVVLDGGKHNHLREKTSGKYGLGSMWQNNMIQWVNCRNIRVENINIQHQRWWAINHIFCNNVTIKNVHFYAIPHVNNLDGIDMRAGCNHFYIENITGRTADDTIAMTTLKDPGVMRRIIKGKENDFDIHDIKIKNVISDPIKYMCIRMLNHDGNKEYNIDIDGVLDVSDYCSKQRSGTVLGFGSPIYYHTRPREKGELFNITAKNLTSRSFDAVLLNQALEHSSISNLHGYGDVINLFSVGGVSGKYKGCFLDDVKIDHIYYSGEQKEYCVGGMLNKDDYHGTAFNFEKMTGNVALSDIYLDEVDKAVSVNGGLEVKIDNFNVNYANTEFEIDTVSKVILDGKEVNNG